MLLRWRPSYDLHALDVDGQAVHIATHIFRVASIHSPPTTGTIALPTSSTLTPFSLR